MKVITVVLLCLLLFCNTAIAEDWEVTWEPIKESIVDKEYGIAVQNLQDVKRDVNISSFFAETDFDITELSDVKFYEWKLVSYTYTENHYTYVDHNNYDEINSTWNNWTEQVYVYTETIESEKLNWKECKAQLFKETGTTKEDNYGFINIPKFGSEVDGDGTYNGTKLFKLTFKTPIVYTDTYGSFGKVALLLDGEEHHPYWNTSWNYKKELILTGNTSGAQTDYQVLLNISWLPGMQTDFDDLRFCNDTDEIDSDLDSKVDGSYALVWVEFPTTPANGINQTYYMYYGNSEVPDNWNGSATFVVYDIFDTLDNWAGGVLVSTPVYKGTYSDRFTYALPTAYTLNVGAQILSAMFYDDGDTTIQNVVSHALKVGGASTNHLVGIVTDHNLNTYTTRYGATWSDTGIARITGWHKIEFIMTGSEQSIYLDGVLVDAVRGYDVGTENAHAFAGQDSWSGVDGFSYLDRFIIRKYAVNSPTHTFGDTQYYTDTMYYNKTSPYNHTIDSTGAITTNRTTTPSDNIGWYGAALTDDCYLVITDYNLVNDTVASFELYTSSLDWFTITGLHPSTTYNLQFPNGTIIECHKSNGAGQITFSSNLTQGSYQITIHVHPFLFGAYQFYNEMENGLTNFKDGMGKYLVWGIMFFAVGLAFTLLAKIKQTLIGDK